MQAGMRGGRGMVTHKYPYAVTVSGKLEYEYSIESDSIIGSCKIPLEYIQELDQLIEKMLNTPLNQS